MENLDRIALIKEFMAKDLPIIQKKFVESFDGTKEAIINNENINAILHVSFTAHYFYVSGNSPENTITTKNTDGSYEMWGSQSKEAEHNAFLLSRLVKEFINENFNKFNFHIAKDVFSYEQMKTIGKTDRVKKRIVAQIDNGEYIFINGLTRTLLDR